MQAAQAKQDPIDKKATMHVARTIFFLSHASSQVIQVALCIVRVIPLKRTPPFFAWFVAEGDRIITRNFPVSFRVHVASCLADRGRQIDVPCSRINAVAYCLAFGTLFRSNRITLEKQRYQTRFQTLKGAFSISMRRSSPTARSLTALGDREAGECGLRMAGKLLLDVEV
eukprot:scaffold1822_cov333-Pavlova_lutheri.AAC.12